MTYLPAVTQSRVFNLPPEISGKPQVFQTGQLLKALALTDSQGGYARVLIGNQEYQAETRVAVRQGSQLTLEVLQLAPQPRLRLVESGLRQPLPVDNPQHRALGYFIPKQEGLSPLLAELISRQQHNNAQSVSVVASGIIKKLLNGLPDRAQIIHAAGLRQAIQQSGLFLEKKLSASTGHQPADISADLKAQLLRLLGNLPATGSGRGGYSGRAGLQALAPPLPSAPPQPQSRVNPRLPMADTPPSLSDLSKMAEGAVSRLVLNQLATVENINEGRFLWQLEIPVHQDNELDVVSLNIEKRQAGDTEEMEDAWQISLALDLPMLGSIQVQLNYNRGGLSSALWARESASNLLLSRELDQLRANLQAHGLEVKNLVSHTGSPPVAKNTVRRLPILSAQA